MCVHVRFGKFDIIIFMFVSGPKRTDLLRGPREYRKTTTGGVVGTTNGRPRAYTVFLFRDRIFIVENKLQPPVSPVLSRENTVVIFIIFIYLILYRITKSETKNEKKKAIKSRETERRR